MFRRSIVWPLSLAIGLSSAQAGSQPGSRLVIDSPRPGATVRGQSAFSVTLTNLPGAASVEFWLGALRLGTVDSPPYTLLWNTGYGNDGGSVLTAIARDPFGNVLATAEQHFVILNQGNSLIVNSPDLSQPLSGTVKLSLSASESAWFPAFWPVYIDGDQLGIAYTDNAGLRANTVAVTLDTTSVPNGSHELHVGLHSDHWTNDPERKSYVNWRGMVQRLIKLNNGHSLMEVTPDYLHVYLTPGQSIAAGCRHLFTDNTSGPCEEASYHSSDSAVAPVNATNGVITALAPGFAAITVTSAGKTGKCYVWVRTGPGIPHFAGNGQMLTSYRPGNSLFFIAPFGLEPRLLRADAALLAEARRAGINTLTRGFYINPRNITASFPDWQTAFSGSAGLDFQWARINGFHLYGVGDDCCREIGSDAWYTLNWPFGRQAMQYAMSQLAATGVALGVDMVDEATMIWGPTPRPSRFVGQAGMFTSITCSGDTCVATWPNNPIAAGRQFALQGSVNAGLNTPPGTLFKAFNASTGGFAFRPAGRVNGTFAAGNDPQLEFLWWSGLYCNGRPCTPPLPNTAIRTLTDWLREAGTGVPVSWPPLGISPVKQQAAWMGPNSVSDFASHYWDTQNIRKTYPWGTSVAEEITWMRNRFYERQPYIMQDRPQVMLKSMAGFSYRKQRPGSSYTPPGDVLDVPGPQPEAVGSGVLAAAALGVAGVRVYNFEDSSAAEARASAALGGMLSTGARPFAADPLMVRNWRSLAYASSLLTKVLQPYLVGTALNSPAHGKNIVTAARQGNDARLLLIVNGTGWDRTLRVDFTPYRTGNPIARYAVAANRLQTATLPDAAGETTTLRGGEAVAYLFPLSAGTRFVTPVQITPAAGYKVAVQYNYLYADMVQEAVVGVECSGGCVLPLDRRLGEVFYRYFYMNGAGEVLFRSPVTLLPAGPGALSLPAPARTTARRPARTRTRRAFPEPRASR